MAKYQVMGPLGILHECDNRAEAKRECVEWAAYDDIMVTVIVVATGEEWMSVDGYGDANNRFPRLAEKV
jgi:hypothetical protein